MVTLEYPTIFAHHPPLMVLSIYIPVTRNKGKSFFILIRFIVNWIDCFEILMCPDSGQSDPGLSIIRLFVEVGFIHRSCCLNVWVIFH